MATAPRTHSKPRPRNDSTEQEMVTGVKAMKERPIHLLSDSELTEHFDRHVCIQPAGPAMETEYHIYCGDRMLFSYNENVLKVRFLREVKNARMEEPNGHSTQDPQ